MKTVNESESYQRQQSNLQPVGPKDAWRNTGLVQR